MTDSHDQEQLRDPVPSSTSRSFVETVLFSLSIGLGFGSVPTAPGTFGSLWGPVLVYALKGVNDHWSFLAVAGVALYLIGIPICATGIRRYQVQDPKHVVFDEIAAFPWVFLFVPLTWGTAGIGFLLFRFFDILKPWPIRRIEHLPGAWGVMSDDVIAGVMAGLVLTACWLISGGF